MQTDIDRIIAIPALSDNYIWAIVNQSGQTIVIDPGESDGVIDFLQKEQLSLQAILITHHHWDHTNGIAGILHHFKVPVYGPASERIANVTHPVNDNDQIHIANFPSFTVLSIPGHTRGHIAYRVRNHVFCGDTLFAAGCGRLFEGTPPQMYQSLQRLAALPNETLIYCAHEYTLNNLRFAQTVEPTNQNITKRIEKIKKIRDLGNPSLPVPLADEKLTNPFLRCTEAPIQEAASRHLGTSLADPIAIFAEIRKWKDGF